MNNIKGTLLFVLKSFVFSAIFISTIFIIYAISPFNSSRKNTTDISNSINIAEYNRQIEESAKMMERQKELYRRAEENIAQEEKNTKRMTAILDLWERQAKREK